MEIVHRITLSVVPDIFHTLSDHGVEVKSEGLVAFELAESDPRWIALAPLFREWRAGDSVRTEFSSRELEFAQWLEMAPAWHHGYPQPDEDRRGYLAVTFEGGCADCGVGALQVAAYRMASEPRWGRNGILQLNWCFGDFFVKPNVWKDMFEPLGAQARSVLDSSGEEELETVLQILVNKEVDLAVDDLESLTCGLCGARKYSPVTRGGFPEPVVPPSGHIVRSRLYFGSGASAFQPVLVSRDLFARLRKVKGVGLGRWGIECKGLPELNFS